MGLEPTRNMRARVMSRSMSYDPMSHGADNRVRRRRQTSMFRRNPESVRIFSRSRTPERVGSPSPPPLGRGAERFEPSPPRPAPPQPPPPPPRSTSPPVSLRSIPIHRLAPAPSVTNLPDVQSLKAMSDMAAEDLSQRRGPVYQNDVQDVRDLVAAHGGFQRVIDEIVNRPQASGPQGYDFARERIAPRPVISAETRSYIDGLHPGSYPGSANSEPGQEDAHSAMFSFAGSDARSELQSIEEAAEDSHLPAGPPAIEAQPRSKRQRRDAAVEVVGGGRARSVSRPRRVGGFGGGSRTGRSVDPVRPARPIQDVMRDADNRLKNPIVTPERELASIAGRLQVHLERVKEAAGRNDMSNEALDAELEYENQAKAVLYRFLPRTRRLELATKMATNTLTWQDLGGRGQLGPLLMELLDKTVARRAAHNERAMHRGSATRARSTRRRTA